MSTLAEFELKKKESSRLERAGEYFCGEISKNLMCDS